MASEALKHLAEEARRLSTDFERARDDARRWIQRAGRLIAAFDDGDDTPSAVHGPVEALRHKRDTLETKLTAFDHHRRNGRLRGAKELETARRELREAWRIAIRSLDRDALT